MFKGYLSSQNGSCRPASCSSWPSCNVAYTVRPGSRGGDPVSRTDERYPSPAHPGAADQAIRYDQGPRERPRPGSREDLQERLDRLPPGHPSSPYNADGSRRPPPPRLRDYELPPPDGPRPPDPDPYLKPVPRPRGF